MISNDFPAQWPGLLENVQRLLTSSETREMMAGCVALLEIVKAFRYRRNNADILVNVIETTFPAIVELGLTLMNAATAPASQQQAEEIPYLLHIILKAYKSTLVLNLSAHQQSSGSIVPWGRLLFAVINFRVPKELLSDEEEEREKCEWWKAKKWAYGTLDRLFHR
jgi:importin-7